MAVLDRATAWWHASRHKAGDPYWKDLSGNGHHAQLGSTSGADSNDPTFLPYDGTQYAYLSGAYAVFTTSNSAANSATPQDLDLRVKVWMEDWTPSNVGVLFNKQADSFDGQIYFRINTDGKLYFLTVDGGTKNATSTAAVTAPTNRTDPLWLRVLVDSGTDLKFYTSTNGTDWTQLGSTITISWGVRPGNNDVVIGNLIAGNTTSNLVGGLHKVWCQIGTTVYWDIDFEDETNVTPGLTSFTDDSSYSNTVTIYRGSEVEPLVVNRNLWQLTGDDYFEVPDHADLDFTATDSYTIGSALRKIDNVATSQAIVTKRDSVSGTDAGYCSQISTIDWHTFGIYGTGAGDADNYGPVPGGPATLIARYDLAADELECAYNANLSGSPDTSVDPNNISNNRPLRFGATSNATPANYARGALIGVAIFREALTDDEVEQLHHELLGYRHSILDRAQAWWHAGKQDDSDTEWLDQSGNGHDAQLGSTSGADSNDPTFLRYDGEQYIYRSDAPIRCLDLDSTGLQGLTTEDTELQIDCALEDWTGDSGEQNILETSTRYSLKIDSTTGYLTFEGRFASSGNMTWTSSAAISTVADDGDRVVLKFTLDRDNGASGSDAKFYYKNLTDGDTGFTQLGSTITGSVPVGNWDVSTYNSYFGGNTSNYAVGKLYWLKAWAGDSSTGTLVLHIDCAVPAPGDSSFASSDSNADTITIYRGDYWEPQIVNRSLWYFANDDYVEVADHDDLDFNDVSLTAYSLIRKQSNVTVSPALVDKGTGAISPHYALSITTGEAGYASIGRSGSQYTDVSATLSGGERGVGMVFDADGDTLEAFADATPSGSPATSTGAMDMRNSTVLRMGASADGTPSSYHRGSIIASAIFREALPDVSVESLHSALRADNRLTRLTKADDTTTTIDSTWWWSADMEAAGGAGEVSETASANVALPSDIQATASVRVRPGGYQVLQPDGDSLNVGPWTDELGGSVNIYQSIDELRHDDSDYIKDD